MIAILLCAGFGTRMYPLTEDTPKALLPIAGRPVVDYLFDQLAHFPGLKAIHLLSNNRFYPMFQQWRDKMAPKLGKFEFGLCLHNNDIDSSEERLGAIGDLALVLSRIEAPAGALIAAGDNLLQFELMPVWDEFRLKGRNLVIALEEGIVNKLKRTGVLLLDGNDRVVGFEEKPAESPSHWICPPFYFLGGEALNEAHDFLNQPSPPDAMGYLIQYLVDQVPIYAYKVEGCRQDIGSIEGYQQAIEHMKGL
jgi:glucose-1-phosphate thymidylyltransferase